MKPTDIWNPLNPFSPFHPNHPANPNNYPRSSESATAGDAWAVVFLFVAFMAVVGLMIWDTTRRS